MAKDPPRRPACQAPGTSQPTSESVCQLVGGKARRTTSLLLVTTDPRTRVVRRSLERLEALRKSSLRDESSMANPSLRSCSSSETKHQRAAAIWSGPGDTVGPEATCSTRACASAASSALGTTRSTSASRVPRLPKAAGRRGGAPALSPGPWPREQPGGSAVRREAPRREGLPERGVARRHRHVCRRRDLQADPAAQPWTAQTTGTCTLQSRGISRCAWEGTRR